MLRLLSTIPDVTHFKEGAFDEAVKGVDAIEHTASPFHFNPKEPEGAQKLQSIIIHVLSTSLRCRCHRTCRSGDAQHIKKCIEKRVCVATSFIANICVSSVKIAGTAYCYNILWCGGFTTASIRAYRI